MRRVVDTLQEHGYTVWTTDTETPHILISNDDAVQRARVVNGQLDNNSVHVQDTLTDVSSLDVLFIVVEDSTIVADPSAVTTARPVVPLRGPTPLNPRTLEEWYKENE